MIDRTNAEWVDALSEPGPEREDALAELRERLLRGLRYAMADRPAVTEAHLEGFVQEALLKIHDNLTSFRGDSRFTTWAQKIAIHEAFSELRRKRWSDVSLDALVERYEGDYTPAVLEATDPSPEQLVTGQALMDLVMRLIADELTERQRRALVGVVFAGMPTAEVARQMGTNRNALYKLIHDARQRLKHGLLEQGISVEEALRALSSERG